MKMIACAAAFAAAVFFQASAPAAAQSGDATAKADLFSPDFGSLEPIEYIPLDGAPDALTALAPARYAAHAKYASVPPAFKVVPDEHPEGSGQLVVIGSDVARFYPHASLSTNDDLAKLGAGAPLPFGTVLAVGDAIRSTDNQFDDLFSFQDILNWFYPTTYKGVHGLVFGADLYGLSDTPDRNEVAALRYHTNGRYDSFYPVEGLDRIDAGLTADLVKDRIAFRKVPPSYYLSVDNPDDMIALYKGLDAQVPEFITTDLIAHSLHLVFDRYLQRVEEDYFAPRLARLVDAYLAKLDELIAADPKSIREYTRTLQLARLYFEVPRALLEAAPFRSNDDSGNLIYDDKDADAVYAKYSADTKTILGFIKAHEGFETIPGFSYKEDFSQYKPRGHYTRNGILSAYFMAMMWFGRINMYMAVADPPPLVWMWNDAKAKESATELSLQLTPVAVLLNDLAAKYPALLRAWRELFDPITYLVGVSDDLSFDDVMPFVARESIRDFPAWTANEKAIIDMVKRANGTLRPPLIAGNSVMFVPSGTDRNPPMGWRLFGQRFTYDSAVHEAVSDPRLRDRTWVSGLDIMKAFGSTAADRLLENAEYGYGVVSGLKAALDKFQAAFSSYKPEFWGRTYYNRTLFLIKSQAQFEHGAGFYFTETPAWDLKALVSAHGTWAELRHDTLLYAKQVYGAEKGGGGDYEPSWRIKNVPPPINYIEPNLPFFTDARLLVRDLYDMMAKGGLMPQSYAGALEALDQLLGASTAIVKKEGSDEAVTPEENDFISSIPSKLATIVSPEAGAESTVDPEQLKMALIADVYTAVQPQQVLEVGVGVPNKLYVLLSDGQGGKRVAVGYTYSYYEFKQPMSERMSDEQWKAIVYDPKADLSRYEPDWSKGLVK